MSKKFWNFRNAKEDPKIGELDIYGEIADSSWWGDEVTPKQFKKDMDALGDISILNVYINSPGGDVFAGQTIYSILKRKKCTVNVYIDGLAASAASVIAMVGRADGNTLNVPKNAMLMIHNPWSLTWGYASDMRQMADTLDKIRDSIVAVYKDGSGLEDKDIIELMDAETWMTAQDALDYGFIDHIEDAKQVAAMVGNFDLSRFKNVPKELVESEKQPSPDESNKLTVKVALETTPEYENYVAQLGKAVVLLEEIKTKLTTEEKPADKDGFFDTQLSEKINQLKNRRNTK